ncbi:MAG: single-stranded-DNA-specific exonuclease RecJ [Ignavibacteriaceae bacterium]|nr:single-stranded-DNA-specific exonuclease RecJ [Ignavibacteriaceae bacterium]
MLRSKWKIKEIEDRFDIVSLADSLNISEVLAKVLIERGIRTFNQAKQFFNPHLNSLHDPFLMNGMDIASGRVIQAITNYEKILVYGDYDVDGTCATSLMFMYLRELGANVSYYIPNRIKDGYGLSISGIDYAISIKTGLIISVDCGITAFEEAEYAKDKKIDLIICDHHKPKESLPVSYAILDPLTPNCNYPFKYLSGAGVAFKLAQAVSMRIGKKDLPYKYLDLVALAGAADIVPLVDENRILVKMGLDLINSNPRPGIAALMKNARLEPGNLTSGQIVYSLAPRINAAGRISDASTAVELMITNSVDEAVSIAQLLENENYERRKIDEETLFSAISKVESSVNLEEISAIVLHEEDWHPGVIGIVASRLVEKYCRPAVMLTTIDGVAKGSARSISNFNLYEALNECSDLLLHYGGHQAAAGISLDIKNVPEFREKLNNLVRRSLINKDFVPVTEIDSVIKISEITPKFIKTMHQFAPFGPENPRPTFLANDVKLCGNAKIVGNNHLLFYLRQNGGPKVYEAIGFELGYLAEEINDKDVSVDLVFVIDHIIRDNRPQVQLKIKDIAVKKNGETPEDNTTTG